MGKYNAYYFFKNIEKKMNNNLNDSSAILNEIDLFIEKNRSYDYFNSFKNLEEAIYQSKNSKKINIDKITEYVQNLIVEIENETIKEDEDYIYNEEKLRRIIFSIK